MERKTPGESSDDSEEGSLHRCNDLFRRRDSQGLRDRSPRRSDKSCDDEKAFLAAARVGGACKANPECLHTISVLPESGVIQKSNLRSTGKVLL